MLSNVTIGPGAAVGAVTVLLGTLFMVIKYTLQLITHLPDNLPRWVGGQGTNMGSTQAAESANSTAGGKGASLSDKAGTSATNVSKRMADDAQRNRDRDAMNAEKRDAQTLAETQRAADRAEADRKHDAQMNALNRIATSPMGESSKGEGGSGEKVGGRSDEGI